ncbi:MAG: ParB/RepB/Spo0J family partition protein [Bacteroidales bacterium]|nr:ParB/RepB/Spo0J family partition protein [Bacteroidales bacterium]
MTIKSEILRLEIKNLIDSPFQGRLFGINDSLTKEEQEKIVDLSESIRENGLLNPIVVRLKKSGKYEIIDGHRRVIANRLLGHGQIKAIVREYSDKQAQIFNIIGNLQRQDLNNIELALAYQRALDSKIFPDKRTLANSLGIDETYVGDLLNMLRMDKRVVNDLLKNRSIKDVRILRMIRLEAPVDENGNSNEQLALYNNIKDNNLSRGQVITLIRNRKLERKKNENKPLAQFNIKHTDKTVNIKLKLDGVSKGKKLMIQKVIDKRMQKLQDEINELLA